MYIIFLTIATIIATISGLLAIIVFQRIAEVKEYLLGDGEAHYNREKGDSRYGQIDCLIKKEKKRKVKKESIIF